MTLIELIAEHDALRAQIAHVTSRNTAYLTIAAVCALCCVLLAVIVWAQRRWLTKAFTVLGHSTIEEDPDFKMAWERHVRGNDYDLASMSQPEVDQMRFVFADRYIASRDTIHCRRWAKSAAKAVLRR